MSEFKCSYCKQIKPRECFVPEKVTNDRNKLFKSCGECRVIARDRWRNAPDKAERMERNKAYKADHAATIKEQRKAYLDDNKEYVKKRYRTYCVNNREKMCQIATNYRNSHVSTLLRGKLRARLNENITKNKGTLEYIGTTIEQARHWLETNFGNKVDMGWGKDVRKTWHLDHTIPINLFNMQDEHDINICFNWKNLMPLYVETNIRKSDCIVPMSIVLQELLVRKYVKDNNIQDDVDAYFKEYANYFKKFLNDNNVRVRHTLLRETP